MSLFDTIRRTFGKFDPFLGESSFHKAYDELLAGSWTTAQRLLDEGADVWVLQELLTYDHSEVPVDSFERWATSAPSAQSLSMLARAKTRDAWNARGREFGHLVSDDAKQAFHAGLVSAEVTIANALDMDATSPEPWAAWIRVGRGLGADIPQLKRRFDRVHEATPFRADACKEMLQSLCDKWGGSDTEMFGFAQWIESNAPVDATARGELATAHLEYAMQCPSSRAYLELPAVASELTRAAQSFLDATQVQPTVADLWALNLYLVTLYPVDTTSADVVRRLVDRISDRPTYYPYYLVDDDALAGFNNVRRERLKDAKNFD